ncbi:PAAR domain-containing protein [Defluviimonas sp. WL0024]|uniref:PAAR domain-containing protein n=1 Tax=Albidovulum salinarum TaxID=2984153 RepID=A0ABT2X7J1_9RHOB|nr:PAAR domain-containing protein [Defluviimonas sp. WL0024]MCU9849878.1 PAAR domain-containing protein [Defluviimonas sp. WL0024]
MGQPQARVTDMHACSLPSIPPPPVLPVPLPIAPPCLPTVLVGCLPAARMTDMTAAAPPHPILKGSATVLIGNLPAARIGDTCACGGAIVLGCFTVLVGG